MCGIIGYKGSKLALPILLQGLQRLEYRGYDSAGLAVVDNDLLVRKVKGRVQDLLEITMDVKGSCGIAHTRWATHGRPNAKNAHPHANAKNSLAIVHNGIVENHHALRAWLKDKGYVFVSDTDSEVLTHLITHYHEGNLLEAVQRAITKVEGAFGLAVVDNKGSLVATRRGSPLCVGFDQGACYVASDPAAFSKYCTQVTFLEDDDVVLLDTTGLQFTNNKSKVVRESEVFDSELFDYALHGHETFMQKEIYEQPESLRALLAGRMTTDGVKISMPPLKNPRRIVLTACGTSWHAALIGKYLLEHSLQIPVEVDYASEFRYRKPVLDERDVLIVISQSGETADTLAALRLGNQKGAHTIGIVNVVGSTISRETKDGVYIRAGPEIGVASTKVFTGAIGALALLASYWGGSSIDLRVLPALVQETLKEEANVIKAVLPYAKKQTWLFLGRGMHYPVALEGALKLKEVSYVHAEGYPAAELKHGPLALIEKDTPVVVIALASDPLYEKVWTNMEEVRARGGSIIAIAEADDERIQELAHQVIRVPRSEGVMSTIVTAVPMQLIAYHIARHLGRDVDKPRNLAKSVTVE